MTPPGCSRLCGLLALLLCGCVEPEVRETVVDLQTDFALAHSRRERQLWDLGTPQGRDGLGSGWSWNEQSDEVDFVWGTGSVSELRLFLTVPRQLTLIFRCFPYRHPGSARQRVRPTLNGHELEAIVLAPHPEVYRLRVPETYLTAGTNQLEFRYAYSQSPHEVGESADRRELAVGWDWIRIEPGLSPGEPTVTADGAGLELPVGSQVDLFLEPRGGEQLVIERLELPEATTVRMVIEAEVDGRPPVRLAEFAADLSHLRLPLPFAPREPLRVGLRAEPVEVREGAGGAVRLLRARVEAPIPAPAALPTVAPAPRSASRALNILLYVVDTLRADHLGIYGYPRPISPRLDEFARDAVVFDSAIAQSSWTKPTVASIFTGLRTTRHGVNHREHRLPESVVTLAEILRDAGYATAAFAANAYFTEDSGLRQGFHEFVLDPVRADDLVRASVAWLDGDRAIEPFFLYLHTIDPHAPYAPPEAFRRLHAADVEDAEIGTVEHLRALAERRLPRTERTTADLVALYDAEIAFHDVHFGRLLDALRERGLYDEMLIVFASDHGESFYEHGVQGHGWDLYREVLEVPLILKLPESRMRGRIAQPVQQIDLLPTLLEVAGLPNPVETQGRSLLPLLLDRDAQRWPATEIYSYLDYEGRQGMSILIDRWKLIEPLSASFSPRRELYDRLADPGETKNLALDRAVLAGFLASRTRGERAVAKPDHETETQVFDEETRRRLEALGYLE